MYDMRTLVEHMHDHVVLHPSTSARLHAVQISPEQGSPQTLQVEKEPLSSRYFFLSSGMIERKDCMIPCLTEGNSSSSVLSESRTLARKESPIFGHSAKCTSKPLSRQ